MTNSPNIEELIKLANVGVFDPRHPTLPLLSNTGQVVLIDEKLVPTISRLWKLGINTEFSCQGTADMPGYISFPSLDDCSAFVGLSDRLRTLCNFDAFEAKTEQMRSAPSWEALRAMGISRDARYTARFLSTDMQALEQLVTAAV